MDHRHGLRTPVSFSVRVYHHGEYKGSGTARNISRGGVFVELPEGPAINESFIELELMTLNARRHNARRLPGLVVHRQAEGFGVMFADDT